MANVVELQLKITKQGKALEKAKKDVEALDKELKKTNKDLGKTSNSLKNIGKGGVEGIKNITSALTLAAGATALFVQQVNKMNVELKKNAALSGASLETFQAFANFGERAGVSIEHTADAMNNLNLKITEAAELGSGAAVDIFKKLGLDPNELAKITDSGEQMIQFLDKLNKAGSLMNWLLTLLYSFRMQPKVLKI